MGALIVCVVAIAVGAGLGAVLGSRSTRSLIGSTDQSIARSTVVLLLAGAGALIAAQLDLLVRNLEASARAGSAGFGFGNLADAFNALAVSEAFHGVLLYAGALVGLATIVGLLATRSQRP
jgi:hypothetical protein